jgi:hypothetical protein
MDVSNIPPCLLSFTKDSFVLASSDKFYIYSLKQFKLLRTFPRTTLTNNIKLIHCYNSYIFAIRETFLSVYDAVTGIHINSKQFPQGDPIKENIAQILLKPQFCIMRNGNLLAFNPPMNSAVIINPNDFANLSTVEYEFTFTLDVTPLGFTVFNDEIFSINFKGELSKWELLKNHRKVRSKILKSGIEKSTKILAIGSNIFAISTSHTVSLLIIPD